MWDGAAASNHRASVSPDSLTITVYKVGSGGHLNCIPSKHGLVRGNERLSDLRGHCVSRESG